jgi:hypothetical protein
MWGPLRRILARSEVLNSTFGDVILETPPVSGQTSRSFLQWRLKKRLEGNEFFISMKLLPDAYGGPEGSVKNYINLDIANALQARARLDSCIAEYYRLHGVAPSIKPGTSR